MEWNYLVGVTTAHVAPKLLHFTLGTHGTGATIRRGRICG